MDAWNDWQPGPAGQDAVRGSAEQLAYLDTRPLRRAARFVLWSALAGLAGMIALTALIAMLIPHTLLVVILIVVAVPVVLLTLAAGFLIWVGRRAWRSGAWMELIPVASGAPWLKSLVWALRTLLVSKAFWKLGRRVHERGARRRPADGGYAQYQAYPGGPWHQARAGDLSGTTR
jgi:hypothetical protein